MTIFERVIKAKFIYFYEKNKIILLSFKTSAVPDLASIEEYLTNFNSKIAFIMLINASIYQKFTTYFKSSYVRDISS
ncbi:hypothetical protein SAMN05421593_0981 [Chryseobacterium culicis]|uniref:Uncharacterized protein n=1 Tax=Chryseobacterium culicis TaxID=680127 RepID=A0A1H6H0W3_CHRCI|nr:hypothetical protein SAMN05421593_0981 [Chryseobacterium culicis]